MATPRCRRAGGAWALLLAMSGAGALAGCPSKTEPAAAAPPSAPAVPVAPVPAAPAEDPDRALWTGTPQALTFTGAVAGAMKEAGGGKGGLIAGCTKTPTVLGVRLLGRVDGGGKVPYGVEISVLSYKGPKTFDVSKKLDLTTGVSVMVNGGEEGKLPMGLFSYGGTVTIDPGERTGSVDVDMKGGFGRPERGHLKGTWRCPPHA